MPIAPDVILGSGVRIFQPELVNLYGCSIGEETKIGAFVEIQKNARHWCALQNFVAQFYLRRRGD